jgi:hypothetical protein
MLHGEIRRWTLRMMAALAVVSFSQTACATSFVPYQERCVADAKGRYYVVVKRRDKGAVTLTIAERRRGSPPVRSATAKGADGDWTTVDPRIRVRDGDIVHGRIDLDEPPLVILVSSKGKLIVTLDKHGFNNLGDCPGANDLVVYSIKGERLFRKKRSELFPAKAHLYFPRIDGVLSWLGASWLDDKRDQLVIVGKSQLRPLITVSLTTGQVRSGAPDLIERAILERNPQGLSAALDLAKELKLSGSKASLPGILEAEAFPLDQRLRAAVLLATLGDRRGASLIAKAVLIATEAKARAPDFPQWEEVSYAIEHCTEVLGMDALPLLKKTLQQSADAYRDAHSSAFCSLGRKAVPTLIAVLMDDHNLDGQLEAATCLGYLGPEGAAAVPALIKALSKKRVRMWEGTLSSRLDSHAAWALEHIGAKAKAAIPHLEQLAKDPDEDVRDSAGRALKAIRAQLSGP